MSGQIDRSALINGYNIHTARDLLGPEDLIAAEDQGCLSSICTLINHLWITIKRIFHVIFSSDHRWYNNETAREMIVHYVHHYPENPAALDRVRELFNHLHLRAFDAGCCSNGTISHAHELLSGPNQNALQNVLGNGIQLPLIGREHPLQRQSPDEELRMKFQKGATGNITLLERTKQLIAEGTPWQEIEEDLSVLEDSLKTHKVTLREFEHLELAEQKNAYSQLCSLWAPRIYDASNEQNAPDIDSTHKAAFQHLKDPYDLFQTALVLAARELGMQPRQMGSPAFIHSAEMVKVCRLAIFNLLEQAKLDTHSCAGHSVNFNSDLKAIYQPPVVVYTQNDDGEMVEKIYYETDILSSTEVGCDPVGAKRLLQAVQDNNRLDDFKDYLLDDKPSPEELDKEAGYPKNLALHSPTLKGLIDTMAKQIRDRYGVKILPAAVREMRGLSVEKTPQLDGADFQTYVKGAQTPYKLIERAFKWAAQQYINDGVLTQEDLDIAECGEGYGYAKQVIGKLAIFNLLKHATPIHDFCIQLTENVEIECGRYYAYEPEPEKPLQLVAHERYLPSEFCGNGQDDPGTDLIKAKQLMNNLSQTELNFAEDYLYALQLQELYKLRGDQNVSLVQTANAKLEELAPERKETVRAFVNEIIKIHNYVTFSLFDGIASLAFEESLQETPPSGAIKFLKNAPLRKRIIRSAQPAEIPLIRQHVQAEYLREELIGQIIIKDRPKRTAGPLVPVRSIRDHGSLRGALLAQNKVIEHHPADGNCMYAALALEIFRNVPMHRLDEYAEYLREAAADYILANREKFLQAMFKPGDAIHLQESEEDYMQRMRPKLEARLEEHCRKVRDTLEFGTGLELEAISCIFGVPIHVFFHQQPMRIGTEGIELGVIQPNNKIGEIFDGAPIRLIFCGMHYEPLRLRVPRR